MMIIIIILNPELIIPIYKFQILLLGFFNGHMMDY